MLTVQSPPVWPAVQYEALLMALHDLMAKGNSDTEEAEAIREEMDVLWPQLTENEVDFLKGLSSDLYMLTGEEIPESHAGTQAQLQADLQSAHRRRDYTASLRLMRKSPHFLTPYYAAFLRARAYEQLGHLDAALRFMLHAVTLNPHRDLYKFFVLDLLRKSGHADKVMAQASFYVERGLTPASQIQVADLLYLSASELPLSQAQPVYDKAIALLREILGRGPNVPGAPPALAADGYVTLGACFASISQPAEALDAFNKALKIEPDNFWALTARDAIRSAPGQQKFSRRLQSSQGEPYQGGRELFSRLDMAA